MKHHILRKSLVLALAFLFFGYSLLSNISKGEKTASSEWISEGSGLDVPYVYNITKALSDIIYTEYDKESGEIAKGRWFGTKGEHKAAEILYENMTKLGLYSWKEQIKNIIDWKRPQLASLTSDIETLGYGLKINGKPAQDFYISSTSKGPREDPNQIDYNFSYKSLKVIKMPKIVIPFMFSKFFGEDFVFIEQENAFNPDLWPPLKKVLGKFINGIRRPMLFGWSILNNIEMKDWYYKIPNLKGIIKYDFNEDAHNFGAIKKALPIIFVNGTVGNEILDNIDDVTIDFYLEQKKNDSIVSYNVIGQLNGTDPTKTVIVDCLYDSVWCQGTADAAIGMAMVLGVAKYFKDNNITPKYNIKFIGFCGEENGLRGALYYEAAHKDENIIYVIDLNQVGFRQDGRKLTLELIGNKLPFLKEIWQIAKKTDYVTRNNNTTYIAPLWMPPGAPSDDQIFALFRPSCKTICFLKDTCWFLHHRDGLNHMEGDSIKYFDPVDVAVTGEIVLNVAKHLAIAKVYLN